VPVRGEPSRRTDTIFEGTSEIQRLVIARAISGVHVR
jgi:alkylation response protein AidB-like acyl-CoA dehydrogenase